MGVTLYLFDPLKRVRRILVGTATELIHQEHDYTLTAEIPVSAKAMPGEYLGFACVDGRFRLFGIEEAVVNDDEGVIECKASDMALTELVNIVVEDKTQMDATAKQAAQMLLEGSGWALGNVTDKADQHNVSAYYVSLWEALSSLGDLYGVRIIPYYTIDKGEITQRHVDVIEQPSIYRGRLFETDRDASSVYVTYTGEPATVLYGVGDVIDTDKGTRLTMADATWSKSAGDPVDKPKGQTWIEDPAAVAKYGRRERTFVAQGVTDASELIRATWDELQWVKEPAVNASANVADMEMAEGMAWKMVRLGDSCVLRTRHAGDVRSMIIKINRNYVRPHQTKLEIGEELPTLSSRVVSLSRAAIKTKETITLYRNKFLHDEHLIQLNAEAIQLNAADILQQGERIRLHGTRLDESEERIVTVEVEIDGLNSEINLKADKITLQGYVTMDAFEARVAEIERLMAGLGTISTLMVSNLMCTGSAAFSGSLNFGGVTCELQSIELLADVSGRGVTGEYKTIQYKNWDGSNASTSVMTGFTQASFSKTKKTLSFVGERVV